MDKTPFQKQVSRLPRYEPHYAGLPQSRKNRAANAKLRRADAYPCAVNLVADVQNVEAQFSICQFDRLRISNALPGIVPFHSLAVHS